MSRSQSLFPVAATLLSGFVLAASLLLSPDLAGAEEQSRSSTPCTCPESSGKATKPKFAEFGDALDDGDEAAALESVHIALTRVGDGAAYVWHRDNGRLSGIVQPTSSYRNGQGRICRHLIVMLTTGHKTKKTEGVACRADNGIWRLEG
jgi:hypothetical protein